MVSVTPTGVCAASYGSPEFSVLIVDGQLLQLSGVICPDGVWAASYGFPEFSVLMVYSYPEFSVLNLKESTIGLYILLKTQEI